MWPAMIGRKVCDGGLALATMLRTVPRSGPTLQLCRSPANVPRVIAFRLQNSMLKREFSA